MEERDGEEREERGREGKVKEITFEQKEKITKAPTFAFQSPLSSRFPTSFPLQEPSYTTDRHHCQCSFTRS